MGNPFELRTEEGEEREFLRYYAEVAMGQNERKNKELCFREYQKSACDT